MIPGYNSTTIPANHMGMTKFAAKSDSGYQRVSGILEGWISELRFLEGIVPTKVTQLPGLRFTLIWRSGQGLKLYYRIRNSKYGRPEWQDFLLYFRVL